MFEFSFQHGFIFSKVLSFIQNIKRTTFPKITHASQLAIIYLKYCSKISYSDNIFFNYIIMSALKANNQNNLSSSIQKIFIN